MPRKDSFTGCQVMTLPEFFASEAKAEGLGRTGSEVMAETFDEIGREEEAHAARISQPDEARDILNAAMKECRDADPAMVSDPDNFPFEVTRVTSVQKPHASFGGRTTKEGFVATCECNDNQTRTLRYESWQSGGSGYDPPDGETTVEIVPETGSDNETPFGETHSAF